MSWPTGQDYQTAVQSPGISFRDPDLKSGIAELNQQQLPKPRSGSYAIAFKIQSRTREYAVRCFLSESHDRQDRYLRISEFLSKASLKYTVEFTYQRDGILVNGKWYPILKMEWVHGDSLGAYIARNVNSPQNLLELAARWVEMSKVLKSVGMAHGDLQHGNVIVLPDGQIKLIDYDGMYIPALAGRLSEELGQRNYQHPLRTAMDFGPGLDRFSQWVIYVSLVAVSLDPTLWAKLKGGDECLLFRKSDFDDPDRSDAFTALEQSTDERVRSLGQSLRALLYFSTAQVPELDVSGVYNASTLPPPPHSTGGSGWISDHIRTGAPADSTATVTGATVTTDATPPGPAWVLDYSGAPSTPQRFTNRVYIERISLVVSLALIACCYLISPLVAAAAAIVLVAWNSALLYIRYSRQPICHLARASADKLLASKREIARVNNQAAELDRRRAASVSELKGRLAQIAAEQSKLQDAEARECERVNADLRLSIASIHEKRKKILESDALELKRLQQGVGAQVIDAQRKLLAHDQALQQELSSALKSAQQLWVATALNNALLERARITGIGQGLRGNLRAVGIVSAADMKRRGLHGIPGIGPSRQGDLLNWTRGIEAEAMRTRPTSLPASMELSIKTRHSDERQRLEAQRNNLQSYMATEQQRVTARHQAERDSLAQQETMAQAAATAEIKEIRVRYMPQYTAKDGDVVKARAEHDAFVIDLKRQLQGVRQQLGSLTWQEARAKQGHAAYRAISVWRYAQRVVWPFAR